MAVERQHCSARRVEGRPRRVAQPALLPVPVERISTVEELSLEESIRRRPTSANDSSGRKSRKGSVSIRLLLRLDKGHSREDALVVDRSGQHCVGDRKERRMVKAPTLDVSSLRRTVKGARIRLKRPTSRLGGRWARTYSGGIMPAEKRVHWGVSKEREDEECK